MKKWSHFKNSRLSILCLPLTAIDSALIAKKIIRAGKYFSENFPAMKNYSLLEIILLSDQASQQPIQPLPHLPGQNAQGILQLQQPDHKRSSERSNASIAVPEGYAMCNAGMITSKILSL
ncbi:MAG TPA: hypothetical protein VK907_06240 [Phnomibacter sp.]|nr:hypothetical protein [Phnomibacter sp.]